MKVNRKELLDCLDDVAVGLSLKDTVEQSSCYVFKGGRIWTFNEDVLCSCVLPKGLEGMEAAVPSKEFRAILFKLDEEELDVEFKDGQELVLKAKRRRAGVRVESEIILPVGEVKIPDEDGWTELPDGFSGAIDAVCQCVSRDNSLFVLSCLHVGPKGLEACDNYQAIRYFLKTGIEGSVLVKGEGVKDIVGLKMKEWAIDETWVHFRGSGGLTASCRRWQEAYPKLDDLLKVKGEETVLPKGLEKVASAAEVFLDKQSDMVGMTVDVRSGKLRLKAEGMLGWYEEQKKIEYDGDPLQFRITPALLKEVCKRSDRCTVGEDKLMVKGDDFVYVSCLVGDGA